VTSKIDLEKIKPEKFVCFSIQKLHFWMELRGSEVTVILEGATTNTLSSFRERGSSYFLPNPIKSGKVTLLPRHNLVQLISDLWKKSEKNSLINEAGTLKAFL